MQGVVYHKNFMIFRPTEKQIQNKLVLAKTKTLAGAKLPFHMHDYFFSEDLDFRNLIKFSLHFSHFSAIYYAFFKISTQN